MYFFLGDKFLGNVRVLGCENLDLKLFLCRIRTGPVNGVCLEIFYGKFDTPKLNSD